MTIFINVCKALIIKCLDNLITASNQKDAGLWAIKRDTELSKAQISIVNTVRAQIDAFENIHHLADKESLGMLKDIIIEAVKKITEKRKDSGFEDEGTTKNGLLKINTNLDMFLSETTQKQPYFKFLDVPCDREPINIFAFHSLYYYGEQIFIPQEDNRVKKTFLTMFADTNSAEIRQQKEKILFDNLIDCQKKLDAVREGDEFDDVRKMHVIESIEKVQRENAKFCLSKKVGTEIPISVTAFSSVNVGTPSFKPSRGRLEDAMEEALTDINSSNAFSFEKKT